MEQHFKSGFIIAKYLQNHPKVKNVIYPCMLK